MIYMKTHLINGRDLAAYRCLCLDLGLTLKAGASLCLRKIDQTRKSLLNVTETVPRTMLEELDVVYRQFSADMRGDQSLQRRLFNRVYLSIYNCVAQPDVVYSVLSEVSNIYTSVDMPPAPFSDIVSGQRWRDLYWLTRAGFKSAYGALSAPLKIRSSDVSNEQKYEYATKLRQIQMECETWEIPRSNPSYRLMRILSLATSADLRLDWTAVQSDLRDGPGAVFDGSRGTSKRVIERLSEQYLESYPSQLWFSNDELWFELWHERPVVAESDKCEPCRLSFVPKDWKGPRGIFVSHKEAMKVMLAQQALICRHMFSSWMNICHDPYDQSPNQQLAYEGSYSGDWSTLDLSDASDRIPVRLIQDMFHKDTFQYLMSIRATHVQNESERVPMHMFAPMGDGRTFPILTWVCVCIAVAATVNQRRPDWSFRRFSSLREEIRKSARCVRVFGDDVIVRTEYYDSCIKLLQACNLKVNEGKSYSRGAFRESCGLDAYLGVDVTPFRIRSSLDPRKWDVIRVVASHNNAIRNHKTAYAAFVEQCLLEKYRGRIAYSRNCERYPFTLLIGVGDPSRTRGDYSPSRYIPKWDAEARDRYCASVNLRLKTRWNADLQRMEIERLMPRFPVYGKPNEDPRWDFNDWLMKNHNRNDSFLAESTQDGMELQDDRGRIAQRGEYQLRLTWTEFPSWESLEVYNMLMEISTWSKKNRHPLWEKVFLTEPELYV